MNHATIEYIIKTFTDAGTYSPETVQHLKHTLYCEYDHWRRTSIEEQWQIEQHSYINVWLYYQPLGTGCDDDFLNNTLYQKIHNDWLKHEIDFEQYSEAAWLKMNQLGSIEDVCQKYGDVVKI